MGDKWGHGPCKSVPAPTSHTSTSQGWALHTKALAVPHGTNPGRRNNLTTLNLLVPFCKRTSLTGCFCLRLLWQEDNVLISICCTSTIHLHAHPQGKHSTHCANRSDPCRKAPAFSVRPDGAYRAYTLRQSWTWLICNAYMCAGTDSQDTRYLWNTMRYHPQEGTRWCFSLIPFWGFIVRIEALTSSSAIGSSKRRRRCFTIKCLISGKKAQATKDVLAACLATRCHCYRHKLGEIKSWACLFLISIPRFSVTFFPFQFVGRLRFLLPVPCLPGSQWNWHFLRNNQSAWRLQKHIRKVA